MATPKKKDDATLPQEIRLVQATVTLVGDSPLISHAWSQKAKEMLLGKQTAPKSAKKDPRNPEGDYRQSMYYIEGGPDRPLEECKLGFPAIAFKNSAVSACAQIDGLTKVFARSVFHVGSTLSGQELVEIESEQGPFNRDDMVRVGMGTADIRFRAMFPDWKVTLQVRWNEGATSLDQLITLFNIAGFGIGIGDWRPERNGTFGTFHVERVEITGEVHQTHKTEIIDRRKEQRDMSTWFAA